MCVPKLCSMILASFCAVFMTFSVSCSFHPPFPLLSNVSGKVSTNLFAMNVGGNVFAMREPSAHDWKGGLGINHMVESNVDIFPATVQPLSWLVEGWLQLFFICLSRCI